MAIAHTDKRRDTAHGGVDQLERDDEKTPSTSAVRHDTIMHVTSIVLHSNYVFFLPC
jgi:hypothetical protein